ncbi:MAG: beta-ketoacyl synthase chain length factor [Rubrivivax sp.]|nr:beta-ketoacyl synthase chain length factor [Rubrivivax sp.]
MTAPQVAFIEGIALWSPAWPGWDAAAPALRGEGVPSGAPPHAPARAAPAGLPANERRRAPDSVLVALQVAEQAVAMSGRAAAGLASVFTSAHGDLPIVDALARTLAGDPRLLSPTRFHHSVHNAPSGYWAMASGSHAAGTALAAFDHSFGAGLLEALVQVTSDGQPVLLAGCDTEARGPLASVNTSRGLLGAALVLAPHAGATSRFALGWDVAAAAPPASPARDGPFAEAPAANALADALPLFAALARGGAATLALRCGPGTALRLTLQPCVPSG